MIHQAYTEMLQSARKNIGKEKISERKRDKQKALAIEYKKNDDKQENLDNTSSRKKKTLDRNLMKVTKIL